MKNIKLGPLIRRQGRLAWKWDDSRKHLLYIPEFANTIVLCAPAASRLPSGAFEQALLVYSIFDLSYSSSRLIFKRRVYEGEQMVDVEKVSGVADEVNSLAVEFIRLAASDLRTYRNRGMCDSIEDKAMHFLRTEILIGNEPSTDQIQQLLLSEIERTPFDQERMKYHLWLCELAALKSGDKVRERLLRIQESVAESIQGERFFLHR